MLNATAYRVGDRYLLETDREDAVPVTLVFLEEVEIRRSGTKQLMVYYDHDPYGQPLAVALKLGWCRIVEDDETTTPEPTPAGATADRVTR